MTISEWLDFAATQIPRPEARQILESILGDSREALINSMPQEIAGEYLNEANAKLEKRKSGEPLAYVIANKEFYGRSFAINNSVLIPRPETELLAEAVLPLIFADSHCIDVGTGSGCLAITLALESKSNWIGSDISIAALELAKKNAERLNANTHFLQSDLVSALQTESFDLIISNPPYIAVGDTRVQSEVNDWEPQIALYAGPTGVEAIAKLIEQSTKVLKPNGWLAFEFGMGQANTVRALLKGWELSVHKDYAGIERFVLAQPPR